MRNKYSRSFNGHITNADHAPSEKCKPSPCPWMGWLLISFFIPPAPLPHRTSPGNGAALSYPLWILIYINLPDAVTVLYALGSWYTCGIIISLFICCGRRRGRSTCRLHTHNPSTWCAFGESAIFCCQFNLTCSVCIKFLALLCGGGWLLEKLLTGRKPKYTHTVIIRVIKKFQVCNFRHCLCTFE